jgi:predicted O-methyltransferase YrrM
MTKRHLTLSRFLAKAWRTGYYSIRYLLAGSRKGLPALVDFVCADHFLSATQVPSELAAFGKILAARRSAAALEIGTARGGTLIFLCRLADPRATIISIDLPSGGEAGYRRIQRSLCKFLVQRRQRVHLWVGDSHRSDTQEKIEAALGGQKLNCLFIDGDHTYDGAKRDFETYAGMVCKGGIVAFHDIVDGTPELVGGVPRLWRETKDRYRHAEFVADPRQGGFGIGVLYVD